MPRMIFGISSCEKSFFTSMSCCATLQRDASVRHRASAASRAEGRVSVASQVQTTFSCNRVPDALNAERVERGLVGRRVVTLGVERRHPLRRSRRLLRQPGGEARAEERQRRAERRRRSERQEEGDRLHR
jgi:hypothetical protein